MTRIKRHLEPLAIAANVTQAAFCRMDQVLLTFGHLVMTYKKLTDRSDFLPCNTIIRSIEKRWAKTDQEVFIAAVILNPVFRTKPFTDLPFLTLGGIHVMLQRLWTRFYPNCPIPDELSDQVSDYFDGSGIFVNMEALIEIESRKAHAQVGLSA